MTIDDLKSVGKDFIEAIHSAVACAADPHVDCRDEAYYYLDQAALHLDDLISKVW